MAASKGHEGAPPVGTSSPTPTYPTLEENGIHEPVLSNFWIFPPIETHFPRQCPPPQIWCRHWMSLKSHIKEISYKTLVRPILDYCSSVWDPRTQKAIKQLESIQNRAARFVTGDYERKSSVTAMKASLYWESLQQRRQVVRLTNFHQAVAGRLAILVRNILRPVERNLRHTSPASNSFIPIATNKNCYKFSFIPRTIINWNDLPENITSIQDKDHFKQAVNSHLNKQK